MLEIKPSQRNSQPRTTRQATGNKTVWRFITYKDLEKAERQLRCARKGSFRPRMRAIPPIYINDNASA
jgi:hypothetical protein